MVLRQHYSFTTMALTPHAHGLNLIFLQFWTGVSEDILHTQVTPSFWLHWAFWSLSSQPSDGGLQKLGNFIFKRIPWLELNSS
jgi:hypothetical protein